MKTAIIGLPMVGKTSLITILTGVHQDTRIGSTSVRMGVAKVPDMRLEALGRLFEPPKVTYATVEYVDMPAITKENLRDAGSIANLRVVDAFAHVLRLFASDTIPHEKGSVDPLRDLDDLETELILSDLMVIEKRLERLDKSKIRSWTANSNFSPSARPQPKTTSRCASYSSIPMKKSACAAFNSSPRSPCSTCSIWVKRMRAACTSANANTAKAH